MQKTLFFLFTITIFATFSACGDDGYPKFPKKPTNTDIFRAPPEITIDPSQISTTVDQQNKIDPYDRFPKMPSKNLKLITCVDTESVKVSLLGNGNLMISGKTNKPTSVTADDNNGVTATINTDKDGKFLFQISDKNVVRNSKIKITASGTLCTSNTVPVKTLLLKENQVPNGTPACSVSSMMFGAQPYENNQIAVYSWQGNMPAFNITACDQKGICAKEGTYDSMGAFDAYLPDTNTQTNDYVYAVTQGKENGKFCSTTVDIKVCKA